MFAGGRATILVLEDNAAVQELIEQALRGSGHRILSTQNPLEALEVVRRVRIDVLVVGHLLQDQGHAVVDEFRAIQPELAVVTICGPDDDVSECEKKMEQTNKSRMLVVDGGKCCGVISLSDIAQCEEADRAGELLRKVTTREHRAAYA